MANLAVIPARGGSKRIPKKNSKLFLGKPIIQYSIEVAQSVQLFDEILVSTDDEGIANLAETLGAKVPFIRSEKNSNDFATLANVLEEVLEGYAALNRHFDNICLLLPTAPFITTENILRSYHQLVTGSVSAVIPVLRFSYPIQRALYLNEEGKLNMIWPENMNTRSQDLPASYHDSGQFYWLKTKDFLNEKRFFMARVGAIELSAAQVQDIDTEEDWKMAELKYKLLSFQQP